MTLAVSMRRFLAAAALCLTAAAPAYAQQYDLTGATVRLFGLNVSTGRWQGLMVDPTTGYLLTNASGGGGGGGSVTQGTTPWTDNIAQFGGVTVSLGQTTMSASMPVTIASNQSALPISAASLPLPTGAATSAGQEPITAAGTTASTAGAVQGVTNGVPVSISGAVSGSLTDLATAGSAPPSYSAGAQVLSQTLTGGLRVQLQSGGADVSTLPVSVAALPSLAAGSALIGRVGISPVSSAPTGNSVAILTTATSVIPAATFANYAEFQVQGTAGVCASWVSTTITISGTTCTGAGAFYYAPLGSYRTPAPVAMPNTALYAIAAAGSTATVVYQGQ